MRISRKWFNQFMDVQDLSIEEMAKRITDAGFEVEAMLKSEAQVKENHFEDIVRLSIFKK